MELIARRTVMELEGEEGLLHLEEYSDGKTERGKKLQGEASFIPEKQASCSRLSHEEGAELYRLLYKLMGIEE